MYTPAKIHLSEREFELVTNTEWIYTKGSIIKKIMDLFGKLHDEMKNEINARQGESKIIPYNTYGKITKGENYLGLPYVILDYPNYFGKNEVFAIRTMFWWGNFFTLTFHIKGSFKNNLANKSDNLLSFIKQSDFSLCINENEWLHHFNIDNYINGSEISESVFTKVLSGPFIKISKKLPIGDWEDSYTFIIENFISLINFLITNFPTCKKDPLPGPPTNGSGL